MSADPPIGHLPDEHNHQAHRDAAAGPADNGRSPGSHNTDWPNPLPPVRSQHRGGGGYHPGGIRFACDDCALIVLSIRELLFHVVGIHRRGPRDAERMPLVKR